MRVRMEACERARVVRLSEEGYSRHVGLTGMAFSWKLLVGVLVQELVRSTTQRFVAPIGAGLPFSEITPTSPRSLREALW